MTVRPSKVSIPVVVGVVTLVTFIVTTVVTIETRYVKAEQFRAFEQRHVETVQRIHKVKDWMMRYMEDFYVNSCYHRADVRRP